MKWLDIADLKPRPSVPFELSGQHGAQKEFRSHAHDVALWARRKSSCRVSSSKLVTDSYHWQNTIRVRDLSDGKTGCDAILIIEPKAYLGWREQFLRGSSVEISDQLQIRRHYGAVYRNFSLEHLEATLRLHSSESVVQKLSDMFMEVRSGSKAFLRDIVLNYSLYHDEWIKAGGRSQWSSDQIIVSPS